MEWAVEAWEGLRGQDGFAHGWCESERGWAMQKGLLESVIRAGLLAFRRPAMLAASEWFKY